MNIKFFFFISIFVSSCAFGQAPKASSSLKANAKQVDSVVESGEQNKPPSVVKPNSIIIERYDGNSVVTKLDAKHSINPDSTLNREWFSLRDVDAPLLLDGQASLDVRYRSGEYEYVLDYSLVAREPITAYEIRVHVFDPFGNLIRSLTTTELIDVKTSLGLRGFWKVLSESEASQAYASLSYVSQVRTATGKVYEIDRNSVVEFAAKVGRRLKASDLINKN